MILIIFIVTFGCGKKKVTFSLALAERRVYKFDRNFEVDLKRKISREFFFILPTAKVRRLWRPINYEKFSLRGKKKASIKNSIRRTFRVHRSM